MVKNMYQKRKERQNQSEEINTKTNINWYPGHMAKSKKKLIEDLKLIDMVIEVLDARIPISSTNPDNKDLFQNKQKIVILNKSDLADKNENEKWVNWYKNQNIKCVLVNSINGSGIKEVINAIYSLAEEKKNFIEKKGIKNYTIKVAVVGIPNVGKSSFINSLVNKCITKVGNKPGITRSNQWIKVRSDIYLLDTPGILWPKFEEKIGINLCIAGCIKEEIIDVETISYILIENLIKNKEYIKLIEERYKIGKISDNITIEKVLSEIGIKRGTLISGGNLDYIKIGNLIIDEFQTGKIGRITLEKVDEL